MDENPVVKDEKKAYIEAALLRAKQKEIEWAKLSIFLLKTLPGPAQIFASPFLFLSKVACKNFAG